MVASASTIVWLVCECGGSPVMLSAGQPYLCRVFGISLIFESRALDISSVLVQGKGSSGTILNYK